MKLLLSTTQRCGSTWITRALEQASQSTCEYIGCRMLGFNLVRQTSPEAVGRLQQTLETKCDSTIFKTHDIPSKDFDAVCSRISNVKIITIRRDFKDVLVSRYFYYRYYWPTTPDLGLLPSHLSQFFKQLDGLTDSESLLLLIDSPILQEWVGEWAAFEGTFTTPSALRLCYQDLLSDTQLRPLSRFTGLSIERMPTFGAVQKAETLNTGRIGRNRFFREGTVGQWRQWFTTDYAHDIDALVQDILCNLRKP